MDPDVADYYRTREPRYCRTTDLEDAPKALQAIVDLLERHRFKLERRGNNFSEVLGFLVQGKAKLEELLGRGS